MKLRKPLDFYQCFGEWEAVADPGFVKREGRESKWRHAGLKRSLSGVGVCRHFYIMGRGTVRLPDRPPGGEKQKKKKKKKQETKNNGRKTKIGRKGGGGAAADRPPPPCWIRHWEGSLKWSDWN